MFDPCITHQLNQRLRLLSDGLCQVSTEKVRKTSFEVRAVSSAVEHILHTDGVTGSIPVPPTKMPVVRPARIVSSGVEHVLHTDGVSGSIPLRSTKIKIRTPSGSPVGVFVFGAWMVSTNRRLNTTTLWENSSMPNPRRRTAETALTQDRLKSVLTYSPSTGEFTWLERRENGVQPGKRAGWLNSRGYRVIEVDRKAFPAHRLAWLYTYGAFPTEQVDHINGVKSDNRLENLRVVSNSVNQQNKRRARSDSKTGILGVHLHRPGKWQAKINIEGKSRSLGIFNSPQEAERAYLEAKRRVHAGYVESAYT
jgi:HNH endonuclease